MIERWADELEEQLIAASKTDIAIGDTAVGRYEQRRMEDFKQAAPKFTDEQWAIMNTERERHMTNQGLTDCTSLEWITIPSTARSLGGCIPELHRSAT
jgi:hypothetical protein